MADDNLVHCYNLGCGQKFNPSQNNEEACLYHNGQPKFHDAYKSWTCCNKKSTDFSTFLNYPGCTKGKHSSEKAAEAPRLITQTEIRPEKPEEVIVYNGLNLPEDRPDKEHEFTELPKNPSAGLTNSISKYMEENVDKSMSELAIGTSCKNIGCKQIYNGPETNDEECLYHPGDQIFHEGMKYYSCCKIKTTDFETFLKQPGCAKTQHCWVKEEKNVKAKEDWFARNGFIYVNLYCKNSLPDDCQFETNGYVLRAKVSHAFGTKETSIEHHLFGRIDPSESKVQLGERKVEIVLKQATTTSWPRLHYDTIQAENNVF
ncbi:hypothetical protein M3Y97_00341900 [Aphelenchoides bicaudatus]|nr:hypothetical protein M3Y97_00341900 [Aphelenchoides bicaudatus]